MIPQAASAAHGSQSPGLFMLAWGLAASALGLAMVTNFRGFADNFARRAAASSAGLRNLPPWKWQRPQDPGGQTRLLRLIAIPFAIIGPIVIVAGIISVGEGGMTGSRVGPVPSPFRYIFIAFAVVSVGWSWVSHGGLFRPAARRGGWRLAAALLSSLGGLVFGISIAIGQLTIGIVALVIGGLPSLLLLMEGKPGGRGPGRSDAAGQAEIGEK